MQLTRKILDLPAIVEKSHETLEPLSIVNYLQELAALFHKFYGLHKVISDDREVAAARLVLVYAFRIVLGNGLKILGISAPEKM